MTLKQYWTRLSSIAAMLFIVSLDAWATGPRIKQDLFTPNANPVYALDFPPFISTEQPDGGVAVALTHAILQADNADTSISILPLARMLKYYLTQENALAVLGNHLNLTADARKELIFVPVLRLKRYYYVHQGKHPQGLPLPEDLKSLEGLVYGADPEQDVSKLQQAGIRVETGKLLTLLEKLRAGHIDVLAESPWAVDWFLQRNLAADKASFMRLEPMAGEDTVYLIFNKQHPKGEAMARQFQSRLTAMIANGLYQAWLEKVFGDKQSVELHTLPLP